MKTAIKRVEYLVLYLLFSISAASVVGKLLHEVFQVVFNTTERSQELPY